MRICDSTKGTFQVGAKSEVILLDDNGGTKTQKLSTSETAKSCIDENIVKRLASVREIYFRTDPSVFTDSATKTPDKN